MTEIIVDINRISMELLHFETFLTVYLNLTSALKPELHFVAAPAP
jgi:hypothetical protein